MSPTNRQDTPNSESPAVEHWHQGPQKINCAVITVSDTRTPQTDSGGDLVVELLEKAGHKCVARQIVPDEPSFIRALIEGLTGSGNTDAVLITGGTGISHRDQTYETVTSLLNKPLPGYGELFRMLSFEQIGAAAMLSRATGGLCGRVVVLTMPGSPAAVRLSMESLILPELRHLVAEARK